VDGGLSLRQALGVVALVSLLMLNAAFAVPIAYTPASDARPNELRLLSVVVRWSAWSLQRLQWPSNGC
jgi:hypothetical protein